MSRSYLSARHLVLGVLLLMSCPFACSLNPELDVSQYAHTSWRVREGFAKGAINAVAQTPDGYIWLGTDFGLLRFDGVRTVPWRTSQDQYSPAVRIFSLLTTHDGTLWIGASDRLVSLKDGKLKEYAELAGHYILTLIEDHEGTLWISAATATIGRLCSIRNERVQCSGDDVALGRGVFNLYEDRKGEIWAGVKEGLWRYSPGRPKFYPLAGEPDGIRALSEDTDGTLLVGWRGGIYRFVDGKTSVYPLLGLTHPFAAKRILRDRDGDLWIATLGHGIVHVRHARTDVFAQADGLSGEDVSSLFEDREGNIWVATINGLDRFREFSVATLTASQGLSSDLVGAVLAGKDGSVWLSTYGGLDRWREGQIRFYPIDGTKRGKNPTRIPNSLFQDAQERIWISSTGGIRYSENGNFVALEGAPDGTALSITQDRTGAIWVVNEHVGLVQIFQDHVIQQIPWPKLGHQDHASALIVDPSRNGLWIGFFQGGMVYLADGQVRASYTTVDGLGEGQVGGFQFDPDGTLWVATRGGLSRLKDGRLTTLTTKNGLPCDTAHWVMADDSHSLWLYMPCGLLRLTRPELDAWVTDPKRRIKVTVFDSSDGVRTLIEGGHFSPQVSKSADGKLWFLPWDGVSVIDPRHLRINQLPPPVHIERIAADHRNYDAKAKVPLPPLVRDLEIDYTALSLVVPEKVLFRYKLEGYDHDWQQAGTRRQAFYTNLSPGTYHFRVVACNNSGVWNEQGDTLEFSIAPAYYQTRWFLALCIASAILFAWALYRLRLLQVARTLSARFDERLAERTRVARELHDTFLQTVQGSKLVADVALDRPTDPDHMRRAMERLSVWLGQAAQEARTALNSLRISTTEGNDLAEGLKRAADECRMQRPIDISFSVTGAATEMHPVVRDEIYRIGYEAIRNACMHSQGNRLQVHLTYAQDLVLRVSDNGVGMNPTVSEKGREGHFGLQGMRERAARIGSKLTIAASANSGTEVTLTVPGRVVFLSAKARFRGLKAILARLMAPFRE